MTEAVPRQARTPDLLDLGARKLVALLGFVGGLLLCGAAIQWAMAGPGSLGPRNAALGLMFLAGAALGTWLRRRGAPALACALNLVVAMLGMGMTAAATDLGVHSLALAGGAMLVVLGGALLGVRAAVGLLLLNLSLVAVLYAAEHVGAVGGLAAAAQQGSAQRLVSQLMLSLIGLGVAVVVARMLDAHLRHAHEQEERLGDLLRIGSDWTWEMDRRGRLTYLSPSFEARTGLSIAEFMHVGDAAGPTLNPDSDTERLLDALRQRRPFRDMEFSMIGTRGQVLRARGTGEPVWDAHGQFLGWRGVAHNITAEWEAHQARQRAQALLDQMVRISPDAINVARLDNGHILMANAGFLSMTGLTEAQVIGRSAVELGLWSDLDQARALRDALARDGIVRNLRSVFRTPSGQSRDVLLTAASFESAGDAVAVITTRDVTDIERARIQSDAILDNVDVGIALVLRGRFERVNPYLERLFERPVGSLGGQPTSVMWPDQGAFEAFTDELRGAWRQGEQVDIEREIPLSGGRRMLTRLRGSPVDARRPVESGSIWVVEDITERRRAERELAAAKQQAEAASDAKSAFLATMSHEIRTPLNGVLGLARLLQDPGLDARRRADYQMHLIESAELLSGIVSDVLDLSKIEAGHLQIERIGFDLRELVASTFKTFSALGGERGLAMSCQVDDALPARVRGDPVRVRQILANYLSNAMKFTRHGDVALRAGRGRGDRIRFEVRDTGIGVAPDQAEHLFRPFTQADTSTTRRYGGTGLGLSICRDLALRMDGDVGVDSDGASGSTFWVELALPAEQAGGSAAALPAPQERPLEGLCLLLAEDNGVNLLIASAMLSQLGATVIEAGGGLQAITLARANAAQLHAVLMDLHMPDIDGHEATRRLRSDPVTAGLPIFAFSAALLEHERQSARASGMEGFIAKPIVEAELLGALQGLRPRAPAEPTVQE